MRGREKARSTVATDGPSKVSTTLGLTVVVPPWVRICGLRVWVLLLAVVWSPLVRSVGRGRIATEGVSHRS